SIIENSKNNRPRDRWFQIIRAKILNRFESSGGRSTIHQIRELGRDRLLVRPERVKNRCGFNRVERFGWTSESADNRAYWFAGDLNHCRLGVGRNDGGRGT